jgi:glucose-6-phosphate dehydrogenase assembly protein OpcA
MTATDELELGLEVPVGEIDRELRKLWEADEASTNASLMNLAVYTEEPANLRSNSERIRDLTREHACRAILIGMDREGPETQVQAWITAHCHLAHGRKSVCCEQLAFLLKGRAVGRMRNTVFAHLASDLPLVFWWQGDLSEIFEERLYRVIDRFVFDSSEWTAPREGFERIREAIANAGDRMVTQDLSWTRTYHFRTSVAAMFDDPVAQRALPGVSAVRITGHPANRISALMMLAWLAGQAGWRPALHPPADEGGERVVFESRDRREIRAEITWDAHAAPLALLEIAGPECTVSVRRCRNEASLCRRIESVGHVIEQSGPADGLEPEELVADQLSRGGKNSLYLKTLPVFTKLFADG